MHYSLQPSVYFVHSKIILSDILILCFSVYWVIIHNSRYYSNIQNSWPSLYSYFHTFLCYFHIRIGWQLYLCSKGNLNKRVFKLILSVTGNHQVDIRDIIFTLDELQRQYEDVCKWILVDIKSCVYKQIVFKLNPNLWVLSYKVWKPSLNSLL